jgi:dihydroorotase/N-acyl-D-amino-acid deacylase
MVSRRRRHRRRSDYGDRRAQGGAGRTTIDAAGLVVAPGFIDLLGQSEFNVLVDGRAASKLLQGVTTEITGEGSSIAPVNDRMIGEATPSATHFGIVIDWRTLGDYLRRLDMRSRPAINVGTFVGAAAFATTSSEKTIVPRQRRNWSA